MDDYFSNTRGNDELTLREAWDNFTKGLISKEQWNETLEGVKRLRQNVPAVAETWARGTIAPIFGGTGDINELGDTTRNKLIDMLPERVGKFAKNLDAAQRLFTPAALTRHLPTTKEVLKSTPRITPEHEGAETMEDVAGFVSPGTLALANDVGGLVSKGANRLGDYAVQKITGSPTATTTDVLDYASRLSPNKVTTYHGSPHDFDKFDISKTATGENGQAYGYGTYVAEHPDVAGKFKKQNGHLYKVDLPDEHVGNMLEWDKPLLNQSDKVRKSLLSLNDPYINEALTTMPKLSPDGDYWTYMGNTYASKAEALEDANPMKIIHGYTNIAKNPKEISEVLNKAGIKGVKYENFQITKGQGGNTFNYVVFDPADLKILEKNGQSLATSSFFENSKQFKTAQKNAAKPVEEGGLGLPANNTAADRAKAMGFNLDYYHGTERLDRLTENGLNPKRATSGPMPFGTDTPMVASNYATSKKDTSRIAQDVGDMSNYFQVAPKDMGMRGKNPISVERSWYFLPPEKKAEIMDKARRVGYENFEEGTGKFVIHADEGKTPIGKQHFDYTLKHEANGNPLTALRQLYAESGILDAYEPSELADIYKAIGYPYDISQSNAPWASAKGVLLGKARMSKPLTTSNVDDLTSNVIPKLEEAFKADRTRKKAYGADQWDKNVRYTPKEWVEELKNDVAAGKNSYVWTSIPDKVTAELKKMGYDGIIDMGGKMGGEGHEVVIPFGPEQVRSKFAAFDPAKVNKPGLLNSVVPVGLGTSEYFKRKEQ